MSNFSQTTSLILVLVSSVAAQMPKVTVPPSNPPAQTQPSTVPVVEDNTWLYLLLLVMTIALAAAVIWMMRTRQAKKAQTTTQDAYDASNWEYESFDADAELARLRKNKKTSANKNSLKKSAKKNIPNRLPRTSNVLKKIGTLESGDVITEKDFQEKLEKLQYSQLPISRIEKLDLSRPFTPLPISNDEALMSAIEQVQDEYEEDEEIRDLALRVLAAFKTRNSIEALSQIALYDLSSNLRSKAVSTLADFDHESCFEPILLACADPSREVRAAAARGLFRLNFDRADAWSRISESGDEFKMRQAARAAIEADLVERSFDRLIHQDMKYAYEAVTLIALLLKAGETKEIFEAIVNHQNPNVKKAILKIIKITKEPNALEGLYSLLEKNGLSKDLKCEIDETIKEIGFVTV